jgi:hypothetical protein
MPPGGLDDWQKLPRRRLDASELNGDEVSKRIAFALDNGLSVEITYASPDNLTKRTVWPKHLERVTTNHYGATYLRAYCETRGEDRTFRLDRIREARVPDGPPELATVARAPRKKSGANTPAVAKSGGCLLPVVLVTLVILVTAIAASLA